MTFAFAGTYGPEPITDSGGTPLKNEIVSVYEEGTTVPVTLYTDRTMGTEAPNPTTTDTIGNLVFFTAPGPVDVLANGDTNTVQVQPDVADIATILGSVPKLTPVVITGNATLLPNQIGIITADSDVTLTLPTSPEIGDLAGFKMAGQSGAFATIVATDGSVDGQVSSPNIENAFTQNLYAVGGLFVYIGLTDLNTEPSFFPAAPTWVSLGLVGTDGANGFAVQGTLAALGLARFFGTVSVEAGIKLSPRSVSANTTALITDSLINATAALTATFPNLTAGLVIWLKNTSSAGTVTIAAGSGATLGSETPTTLAAGKGICLVQIGTVWHTLTAAG